MVVCPAHSAELIPFPPHTSPEKYSISWVFWGVDRRGAATACPTIRHKVQQWSQFDPGLTQPRHLSIPHLPLRAKNPNTFFFAFWRFRLFVGFHELWLFYRSGLHVGGSELGGGVPNLMQT